MSDEKINHNHIKMPYLSLKALPKSVREHLPKHAQEIYKEAFNHAWDEYAEVNKRRNHKA